MSTFPLYHYPASLDILEVQKAALSTQTHDHWRQEPQWQEQKQEPKLGFTVTVLRTPIFTQVPDDFREVCELPTGVSVLKVRSIRDVFSSSIGRSASTTTAEGADGGGVGDKGTKQTVVNNCLKIFGDATSKMAGGPSVVEDSSDIPFPQQNNFSQALLTDFFGDRPDVFLDPRCFRHVKAIWSLPIARIGFLIHVAPLFSPPNFLPLSHFRQT